ncbi:MAG: MAPEG family protein [Sulfitobacter sp.]
MEIFEAYSHAIASLGLWALISIILAGLSTRGRTPENRCECGKPKRDYANPVYRADRAFMNAIENSGPFIAATVAAILAGAAPFWVNLFASIFIVSRIAMAIVHIRTENQPARSAMFMISFVCMLALALLAVVAAF